MKTFPKSRKSNIVVQELDKELLIYDLSNNKAFCLNESLILVWQYADGRNSVTDISILLSRKLKTKVSEEFVQFGLDQLKKDNLLENGTEFEINFNGLNRRQIIKKIGFASMITLPLISSVVAPTSAMAASCALLAPGALIPNFCASSTPDCNINAGSQCCSGSAISVSQPCPLFAGFNSACACT